MIEKADKVAILYSGGTDSTCAAAIMAQRFKIVKLITLKRFGFFSTDNTKHNVIQLENKFASTVFQHEIIDSDRLARYVSYNGFVNNLFKFGFFALSNCLICSLVNHFRILIYCLDNEISDVADGITKEWPFFPSHMEKVIAVFKQMYLKFNIKYHTPVYDFDFPAPISFADKISLSKMDLFKNPDDSLLKNKKTAGNYLFNLGIFTLPNVKGTALDYKMQPVCRQFILHHIYIFWYFMAHHDYSDFEKITLEFIKVKTDAFIRLIEKNPEKLKALV